MDVRTLPDLLSALRRQDLTPPARQAVEEAGVLLGEGREMEACALAEKAQALAAVGASRENGKVNGGPRPEPGAELLAARLGADITAVLTRVIHELQNYSSEQAQTLTAGLEKRIQAVENDVRPLTALPERCDQLAQLITGHFEAVMARLTAHQERLEAGDHTARDLAAILAEANQRLDRHTEILRGMQQRQVQRSAVINELLGTIAKLRDHSDEIELAKTA